MKRSDYYEYLETPAWKAKAAAARLAAGGRCQLCNSASLLNVHHRTYERVGDEDPGDLTVLCRTCHERFHGIKEGKPRRVQDSRTCADIDRLVEEIVSDWEFGRPLTSKLLAPRLNCKRARVGSSLRRLCHRGLLVRPSKNVYLRSEVGRAPKLPTLEQLDGNRGFTREQLAAWGVPWPPRKGWKRFLRARIIKEMNKAA